MHQALHTAILHPTTTFHIYLAYLDYKNWLIHLEKLVVQDALLQLAKNWPRFPPLLLSTHSVLVTMGSNHFWSFIYHTISNIFIRTIVNSLERGLEKFHHTYTKAEIVVYILNSQSINETECYMVKNECGYDPFKFFQFSNLAWEMISPQCVLVHRRCVCNDPKALQA